ncbi:MAG TPA: GMC family oxidoreductase, partial [Nitrospiraceae bacterium]|nr:GMC family oxidoreductase [Nitrospiraceae bacterium]
LNPTQDSQRIVLADAGSLTGARFSIRASVYVLAGGGIENARLLMLTNERHETNIGNGAQRLGRFFMEHPRLTDRLWIDRGLQAVEPIVNGVADGQSFGRLGLTREAQRREKLLDYYANLSFGYVGQEGSAWNSVRRISLAIRKPWSDSPYLQDAGGGRTKVYWSDVFQALTHPVNAATAIVASGLKPRGLRRFISIISGLEQAPDPNNRIALSGTRRDSFGQPQAEIHWSLGSVERKTYNFGLERVIAYLDTLVPGVKKARLDRARWGDDILGTWHHIGTTRMSERPNSGVVDTDLKVHGMDNLYIVGSSVFPTGGAAAPTLTIVALSLRLADHLCRCSIVAS